MIRNKWGIVEKLRLGLITFLIIVSLLVFVVQLMDNDISNADIVRAYEMVETGQSRSEVNNLFAKHAPYSSSEFLNDPKTYLVLYRFEDKWPLNTITFPRIIEIKYDKNQKVISKRLQLD